ncbi:alpha/beta hydrolase [Actinoallomurus sp. NPDC052274]|uniref:alpha/beta fold hydrolase n=1 Tax=Actinoallomurus sp. NPDC052274 TaxID=3155420 RepID=UPI00344AF406
MAIRLATHDFGGSGTPLLLLHGAGANLVSMAAFARELSARFRVVTVDLRGHGRSEDGPWDWAAVLDDLEAVAGELSLGEPAVVGWSLGGMLAALWAERHPACPMAVSVDGTPPPAHPDQLDGLDPAHGQAELDRLRAAFDGMSAMYARPLAPEEVEAAVEGQRAMARQVGASEEMVVEGFRRNLVSRDGRTWLRPSPDVLGGLRAAMDALDLIPVYQDVRCPLLVAVATEDLPEQRPFEELYAAYRRGFERRLAEAARANPALRVVRVEGASHAMVAERPAELAKLIGEFADAN